ncbi:hypothetical protein WJX82_008725 [Trebouxia sp. C0006]
MHVGLKDVADVLLSALPVDSQGSLKIKQDTTSSSTTLHCQDKSTVQHLLQYKAVVAESKLTSSASPAEATSPHWSCILFQPWSAATLMGYGSNTEAVKQTTAVQREVLKKMKGGELDIVISTAVAEEGRDVAQCQLVLRYDLPSTALAFVQSRGRARAQASSFVLLLEEGNEAHSALVSQVMKYEANMRSHATNRPEQEAEKSLEGEDNKARQDLEADVYKVASTGAQVTLASAKPLLYTFCGKLAYDKWPPHAAFACAHCWYTVLRPRFSTTEVEEMGQLVGYRSTAVMPHNSPVRTAQGQVQRGKALAQASASLEACRQLHQCGALNQNLLPDITFLQLDRQRGPHEEALFAKSTPSRKQKIGRDKPTTAAMRQYNPVCRGTSAPGRVSQAYVLKPTACVPIFASPIQKRADLYIKLADKAADKQYCLGVSRSQSERREPFSNKWIESADWRVDQKKSLITPVELDFDNFPIEATGVSAYFFSDMPYGWQKLNLVYISNIDTLFEACRPFVYTKSLGHDY